MQELKALYDKNLTRPSLDDSLHEEKEIDNVTQEITRVCENIYKYFFKIFYTFFNMIFLSVL